jgi:hypothetical protein
MKRPNPGNGGNWGYCGQRDTLRRSMVFSHIDRLFGKGLDLAKYDDDRQMAHVVVGVIFLIAIINLFYRISSHLAAITTLIYMPVVTWEIPLLVSLLAIPPIAWAKYELHEHNFLQMILGVGLAVAITSLTVHLL